MSAPKPDRRLRPATDRVALAGSGIDRPRLTRGRPARVRAALADLCADPGGARDRQLLRGWPVTVIDETTDERGSWLFLRCDLDGYCGWMKADAVGPGPEPSHRVRAPASWALEAPRVQARSRMRLSMGALLHVPDPAPQAGFLATDAGWLPAAALAPLSAPAADWVGAAEALLGVPYLWGGNSADGIDCSGLVQLARLAAGCADPGPRDSDQQWRHWGRPWPGAAERLERGTLVFWRGHVAIVTGPGALIHANAHHMAVAREPLDVALARIAATDGPPLGIGRPDGPDAG